MTEHGTAEPADNANILVRHNAEGKAFELVDTGAPGEPVIGAAHYHPHGENERIFYHTTVDEAYGGRGLAAVLAEFALRETVEAGQRIVAVCPYIKRYVTRHEETYKEHVAKTQPAHLEALKEARP